MEEVRLLREKRRILVENEKFRLAFMIHKVAVDIERRIIDHILTGLGSGPHICTSTVLEMAMKQKERFEDLFEN